MSDSPLDPVTPLFLPGYSNSFTHNPENSAISGLGLSIAQAKALHFVRLLQLSDLPPTASIADCVKEAQRLSRKRRLEEAELYSDVLAKLLPAVGAQCFESLVRIARDEQLAQPAVDSFVAFVLGLKRKFHGLAEATEFGALFREIERLSLLDGDQFLDSLSKLAFSEEDPGNGVAIFLKAAFFEGMDIRMDLVAVQAERAKSLTEMPPNAKLGALLFKEAMADPTRFLPGYRTRDRKALEILFSIGDSNAATVAEFYHWLLDHTDVPQSPLELVLIARLDAYVNRAGRVIQTVLLALSFLLRFHEASLPSKDLLEQTMKRVISECAIPLFRLGTILSIKCSPGLMELAQLVHSCAQDGRVDVSSMWTYRHIQRPWAGDLTDVLEVKGELGQLKWEMAPSTALGSDACLALRWAGIHDLKQLTPYLGGAVPTEPSPESAIFHARFRRYMDSPSFDPSLGRALSSVMERSAFESLVDSRRSEPTPTTDLPDLAGEEAGSDSFLTLDLGEDDDWGKWADSETDASMAALSST